MASLEHLGADAEEIEVVYENGVLRPVHPLDGAEGTHLEGTVKPIQTAREPAGDQTAAEPAEVDEAAYAAFLDEVDAIAALPLESPAQPLTARDHDAVLYPRHGTMP